MYCPFKNVETPRYVATGCVVFSTKLTFQLNRTFGELLRKFKFICQLRPYIFQHVYMFSTGMGGHSGFTLLKFKLNSIKKLSMHEYNICKTCFVNT